MPAMITHRPEQLWSRTADLLMQLGRTVKIIFNKIQMMQMQMMASFMFYGQLLEHFVPFCPVLVCILSKLIVLF